MLLTLFCAMRLIHNICIYMCIKKLFVLTNSRKALSFAGKQVNKQLLRNSYLRSKFFLPFKGLSKAIRINSFNLCCSSMPGSLVLTRLLTLTNLPSCTICFCQISYTARKHRQLSSKQFAVHLYVQLVDRLGDHNLWDSARDQVLVWHVRLVPDVYNG